jgi:protein SCO1/2
MNRAIVWVLAAGALIAFVLTLAGREGMLSRDGRPPATAQAPVTVGGPFTLVDGAGRTVTDETFRGEYMLVFFGYTFCPDVCPTTLQRVGEALDALGEDGERVRALFVTVDPERDTPEVVGAYVAQFHPRLVGLTGTPEQVAAAASAYRVYYAKASGGDEAGEDTLVDHSAILYLMGPDGAYLTTFSHTASVEEIVAGIREHLS